MRDRPAHQIKPGTSHSLIGFTFNCGSQLSCVYCLLFLCICRTCGFITDKKKKKTTKLFLFSSICSLENTVSLIKNSYQTDQVIVLHKIYLIYLRPHSKLLALTSKLFSSVWEKFRKLFAENRFALYRIWMTSKKFKLQLLPPFKFNEEIGTQVNHSIIWSTKLFGYFIIDIVLGFLIYLMSQGVSSQKTPIVSY